MAIKVREARSMDVASLFRVLDTATAMLLTPLTAVERERAEKTAARVQQELGRRKARDI
jgi:hypothetical protein